MVAAAALVVVQPKVMVAQAVQEQLRLLVQVVQVLGMAAVLAAVLVQQVLRLWVEQVEQAVLVWLVNLLLMRALASQAAQLVEVKLNGLSYYFC
jgi:type IV secretory pathway TrbD component